MSDNSFREPYRPLGQGFTRIIRPNGDRSEYAAHQASDPEPSLPSAENSLSHVLAVLSGKGGSRNRS